METQPTSAEIEGKIAALDLSVSDWEAEADAKSLAAVAGDPAASKALAEINRKIEHAKADRVVLRRALRGAAKAEAETDAKADDEVRERHMTRARLNAARLIEAARHIDDAINQFAVALASVIEAEQAVRADLAAARSTPPGFARGRYALGQEAIACLLKETDGRARFQTEDRRGVAHWADVAWGYLLAEDREAA